MSLRDTFSAVRGVQTGMGFETARALAKMGCTIFLCCRNPKKADFAIRCIRIELKRMRLEPNLHFVQLDLADLDSVEAAVADLKEKLAGRSIDFFINNAGIMGHPYAKSAQGYELHWATNHLGHFAWTMGMLDVLKRSQSKVVVLAGDIALLERESSPNFIYSGVLGAMAAYSRSKIANTCFGLELQKRHPELKVYVVHPGAVRCAALQADDSWLSTFGSVLNDYVLLTPEQGCQSTLLCCLTEEVAPGSYFHNVYGETEGHESAYDIDSRKEIWELSESLLRRHRRSKNREDASTEDDRSSVSSTPSNGTTQTEPIAAAA
jgi:NAD(P)-dependent dehydrogenase (short-subunit alcohol dehydrogenase family)